VYLERLALADIFLCTAGVWVLLSVIQLLQAPTGFRALMLGVSLVFAAFCKIPVGFVFLGTMPVALLSMARSERRALLRRPEMARLLLAHAPVILLVVGVAAVAAVRLRRGQVPGFGLQDLVGIGLGRYRTIGTGSGGPRPNLVNELVTQLSVPVTILGGIGVAAAASFGDWRQRWLVLVGAVPLLGIGLLVSFWFPRYLLFTLPPLIIAAVCGWRALAQRVGRYRRFCEAVVLAACVGFMGQQSARLILDPLSARWSPLDRAQYLEGAGSGYGYAEAANFILRAPDTPQMIYALDGHSAYQLLTYLPPEWRSRVRPIFYGQDGQALGTDQARLDNLHRHTPAWIIIAAQHLHRYLDASFGQVEAGELQLRQIETFDKPGRRAQLAIYAVSR